LFAVVGVLGVALAAGEARAQVGDGVRPVPAESDVAEARRGLRERFARDFGDVTPAGKRRLGALLWREGGRATGDAGVWVALSEARDLAVGAGDVELAFLAAGELGRKFAVDGEAMRVAVLQGLVGGGGVKMSPQQAGVAAKAGRGIVETKLAGDDFEGAVRVAGLAEQAARQAGDISLGAEMALLTEFCRDVLRRAGGYRAALKTLAEAGDETPAGQVAGANQAAGEFLVLVKQEWGRGLVMLSRGTDKALREAAAAELGNARGAELMSAAGVWEGWARKQQGPGRRVAMRHALGLYAEAAKGLEGSDLENCLAAAARVVNGWAPGTELVDVRSARTALGEERWGWWESLGVGGIEPREDGGELVNSQVLVEWKPRLTEAEEAPPAPEGTKLTYVLRLWCIDERGQETVLEEEGRISWRSVDRPWRLTGPKVSAVKRASGGKAVAVGAWVEFRVDGVAVGQRVWKVPVRKAWWWGPRG